MIGQLNHVAIAVPDLAAASALYTDHARRAGVRSGRPAGSRRDRGLRRAAEHQDRAAHPLGEDSPIRQLPGTQPSGGIHHSATRWTTSWRRAIKLKAAGARVLGDGEPKIGAHDKPVLFLHPKDFCGTLVELEQV